MTTCSYCRRDLAPGDPDVAVTIHAEPLAHSGSVYRDGGRLFVVRVCLSHFFQGDLCRGVRMTVRAMEERQ